MKYFLQLMFICLLLIGCTGNSTAPTEEEKNQDLIIGTWEIGDSGKSADWIGSDNSSKLKGPFDDVEWDTLVYDSPDSLELSIEKTNEEMFTFIYESETIATKAETDSGLVDYFLDSPFSEGTNWGGSYVWEDGRGIVIRSWNPFSCDSTYSFEENEVIQYKIAKPYTDTTFNRVYQFKVSGLIQTAEKVMGC